MKQIKSTLIFLIFLGCGAPENASRLSVRGLEDSVEIFRDESGVNHIYAKNEHDLFFAQGYCAAKDRLFQFELWRRQASGTVAEIFGARELNRDIGARLFKFRGDLKKEFNHYHPRGAEIISAFTDGVNAYIRETEEKPELLPLEFELLGIKPGEWTPDLVISRHQGLLGNISEELAIGRAVALVGANKVKELRVFEPGDPNLLLDDKINPDALFENVLELYDAFRKPVSFTQDLKQVSGIISDEETFYNTYSNGSNNWVVAGSHSATGYPLLANDPHRAVAIPSLRYIVHLNAPGWNVVGGGEPTIPGVSIGHNESGAWGLTVFSIDGEDLMVYEVDPKNPNFYKYQDGWEEMTIIKDTIRVKGSPDVYVDHKYTRHGPVTFVDQKRSIAFAVRCAWLEPGGAPYLASLRMNESKNWNEFREACAYSHIPGENMIWADREGNIGWQVVGIAPIRKNWDGLVPVPGDGRYEWEGFLPIKELPSIYNPEKGFWATANENLVTPDYPNRNAVGWSWADSSRANRVNEVLAQPKTHTLEEMMELQFDYYSKPASQLIPFLKNMNTLDPDLKPFIELLQSWDFRMDKNSVAAGLYMAWEKRLLENAYPVFVPEKVRTVVKSVSLQRVIGWITADAPELNGRNQFLLRCLEDAVTQLRKKLGDDMNRWQYGQESYHHVFVKHALNEIAPDSLREIFNCGPLPRGGSNSTPCVTGNNDNQSHGATFRMVADLSDWDRVMFSNAPGQSGDAQSPYYKNLFSDWASDKHFPVFFSKSKIEQTAKEKMVLTPQSR